jgi:hypothetical protein
MKYNISFRIEMPDFTTRTEVMPPEPNPAREIPPGPDPDVQPQQQKYTWNLAA